MGNSSTFVIIGGSPQWQWPACSVNKRNTPRSLTSSPTSTTRLDADNRELAPLGDLLS
jgi:hypothetical protein